MSIGVKPLFQGVCNYQTLGCEHLKPALALLLLASQIVFELQIQRNRPCSLQKGQVAAGYAGFHGPPRRTSTLAANLRPIVGWSFQFALRASATRSPACASFSRCVGEHGPPCARVLRSPRRAGSIRPSFSRNGTPGDSFIELHATRAGRGNRLCGPN